MNSCSNWVLPGYRNLDITYIPESDENNQRNESWTDAVLDNEHVRDVTLYVAVSQMASSEQNLAHSILETIGTNDV